MHKDLFLLLRQYAALVPPRSINFPKHFPLSVITEFIVEHIITNPHFHQYPPAKQFQQQWWKRMISLLEEHVTDQARTRRARHVPTDTYLCACRKTK